MSGRRDSNPRPRPWQGRALPLRHFRENPAETRLYGARHVRSAIVISRLRGNVRDTTSRGDVAELQIAAALIRQGKRLLRPLSSASRYDLLIDNQDGTFTRVQCKSGVLRNGCVVFRVYSVSGHDTRAKGYVGQVDAFGVYCADTSATYLVRSKPSRAVVTWPRSGSRRHATGRVEACGRPPSS